MKKEGTYPRPHDYLEVEFLAHIPGECTREESQNQHHHTSDYTWAARAQAGVRHGPLCCAPSGWAGTILLSAKKTRHAATEACGQDLSPSERPAPGGDTAWPQGQCSQPSSPSLLPVGSLLGAFAHLLSSICLPKLHLLQEALMHLAALHSF